MNNKIKDRNGTKRPGKVPFLFLRKGAQAPTNYTFRRVFLMAYIKLVNEARNHQYKDENALFDLLAYVFRPDKTLEDSVRNNVPYSHIFMGCEPFFNPDKEEEHNVLSVYQAMLAVNSMFPRRCKTLAKHRIVSFSCAELIIPQDADELGRSIAYFYAAHGYIAAYAVHSDDDNVNLHVVINTTSYIDGRGFGIPYEYKNLEAITNHWYQRHYYRIDHSKRFCDYREKILYGEPVYGNNAVFCKDQIRNNSKAGSKEKKRG